MAEKSLGIKVFFNGFSSMNPLSQKLKATALETAFIIEDTIRSKNIPCFMQFYKAIPGQHLALVTVDIDGLKNIDTEFVKEIADKLKTLLPQKLKLDNPESLHIVPNAEIEQLGTNTFYGSIYVLNV